MEWILNGYLIDVSHQGEFRIYRDDNRSEMLESHRTLSEAQERTLELKRVAVKTARKDITIPVLRSNGDAATAKGYNATSGRPRIEGTTVAKYDRVEFYYHTHDSAMLLAQVTETMNALTRYQEELNAYLIPRSSGGRMTGDEVLELEDQLIGKYEILKDSEYGLAAKT